MRKQAVPCTHSTDEIADYIKQSGLDQTSRRLRIRTPMIGNRICAFVLSTAFAIICSAPPAIAAHDRNWLMVAVDYTRPLRKNQHWPCNKKRPNLFGGRLFRSPPNSGGRPHFRLGACTDQCSGWPAHRSWDRAVQ